MRGTDHQTGHLCGYVNPEAMVPAEHPLRAIRPLVNAALERLSAAFDQINAGVHGLMAIVIDDPPLVGRHHAGPDREQVVIRRAARVRNPAGVGRLRVLGIGTQ